MLKDKVNIKPISYNRKIELSDQWINQSETVLKTMKTIITKKDKDRLEIINSMIFALTALDRSIHGWKHWIQNLDFMSGFTKEELQEMEKGLINTVRHFIEYDIDVTKMHDSKIPRIRVTPKRKKEEESSGIYV